MVFDPKSGLSEQLFPYSLGAGVTGYDISPDVRTGIYRERGQPDGRLYWLRADRPEAFDLLDGAGQPRWSPDGRFIAVTGTPKRAQGIGLLGGRDPQNLYFLSSDGKHLRPVIEGLAFIGALAWAPNGKWLMLHAKLPEDPVNRSGLWLFEVSTGKRYLLLHSGSIRELTWVADGPVIFKVETYDAFRGYVGPGFYLLDLPDPDELTKSASNLAVGLPTPSDGSPPISATNNGVSR
jgi:Tol biopolymer transport system component